MFRRPLCSPRFLLALLVSAAVACSSAPEEEPFVFFDLEEPGEADGGLPDADQSDADDGTQPPDEVPVLTGAVDGEACTSNLDCRGGTCIDGPDWPDGYCTTLGCGSFADCASDGEDNRCFQGSGGQNFCVRMCRSNDDCREGYVCYPIGYNAAFCAPNPNVEPDFSRLDEAPFEVICHENIGNQVQIHYEIAEDTVSYMLTPIALNGGRLRPDSIYDADDNRIINFRAENAFQTVNASLFGYVTPLIVPAVPQFESQLQTGAHRLQINTRAPEVCHYLIESNSPGTRVDLNIYLVGVPGISAQSAPVNGDMQAVLAKFAELYEQAGIEVGEVTYQDITGDDADRFSIIRSDSDVARLVALSRQPENDNYLSVNIFFTRQFAFSGGGGAIGISMGLPGPAGLHGTPSSGVVFTSEYMGTSFRERGFGTVDGNEFTGVILAHELGHYLGLFHTTEQNSQGFDPLLDTPECRSGFPSQCPDLGNMMFPLASIGNQTITADQAFVIGVNPLTKD
jgi:hypothetical protein